MSKLNQNSLSLAIGVLVGNQEDRFSLIRDNLTYAIVTRMESGRDTAFETGKARAILESGQKVTKDNRQGVAIASAIKAGFYALPNVLPNYATAFKSNAKGTGDKITTEVLAMVELFMAAYVAALPVKKADKTVAEKEEAKAKKESEVQTAAIAYAKECGYRLDEGKNVTVNDWTLLNDMTDEELTDLLDRANAIKNDRANTIKADNAALADRLSAQDKANALLSEKALEDKRLNEEQRQELTLAAIKGKGNKKTGATMSSI